MTADDHIRAAPVSLTRHGLGGDREERQRVERKSEAKGLIPLLTTIRMSGSGLHGNDNRSLVYHCYILISDCNKRNLFEESFMMRRCCTIEEATWLNNSEVFVTHAEPGQASHLGNLSEERRAAQILGGESVPTRIFEAMTLNCEVVPKPLLKSASDQVTGLTIFVFPVVIWYDFHQKAIQKRNAATCCF